MTIAIGKTYQGGIIFYVNGSGAHGLIAAIQDQSTGIAWFNGSFNDTGATGTAVGTGQANTDNIIAAQGAGHYAASLAGQLVLNGYSDWFLPSKDELNLMYWTIGPGAASSATVWGITSRAHKAGLRNETQRIAGIAGFPLRSNPAYGLMRGYELHEHYSSDVH